MKKLAVITVLFLIVVCAFGLMSSNVSVTINGEEIEGPLKALVGAWGLVIIPVVLLCVAILLAFIFTGVGLIVLGCLAFAGLAGFGAAFPFLLPLLIPLFLVWIFCAVARRNKTGKSN
jgi:hypothetical protein